ncbi:MAG TPA: ACP S-malonyltransferase [Nevskiaceae bacterium]|nr:ACP S-malonyltransferase [Nevskiaceae bacterium]
MKYALLFPGQGSQSVGMLGAHGAPQIAETLEEASAALGWDVAKLVREGPVEELNKTEKTQPALLAASVAVWRHWISLGLPAPSALAGHSLGEYSALVAAGSIGFGDALRLVELRGQLMQAAVPAGTGGMTAVVGLDDDKVAELCKSASQGLLEPANLNAPGQVVVAGDIAGLEWLDANGKKAGARMVKRLAMSVPSHCSLMKGAAAKLADALAKVEVRTPTVPVLHNLDAKARTDADEIRAALAAQLHQPVRWTQIVQALQAQGIQAFLECGPGKVLVGLNKRIVEGAQSIALEDAAGGEAAAKLVRGEAA